MGVNTTGLLNAQAEVYASYKNGNGFQEYKYWE